MGCSTNALLNSPLICNKCIVFSWAKEIQPTLSAKGAACNVLVEPSENFKTISQVVAPDFPAEITELWWEGNIDGPHGCLMRSGEFSSLSSRPDPLKIYKEERQDLRSLKYIPNFIKCWVVEVPCRWALTFIVCFLSNFSLRRQRLKEGDCLLMNHK